MNVKKLRILICLSFLLLPAVVFAQSAAAMDILLQEESLTFGSSAYLVLVGVGEVADDMSRSDAAEEAGSRIALFDGRSADAPISLGEFSYLLMEAAGRSGGLMYRFFPGPRYAARELAFQGVIQGNAYPNTGLSGERALRIIERFTSQFGEEL